MAIDSPISVAIALGSNLGDRASHLGFAFDRLRPLPIHDLRLSTLIDTVPVGVAEQPLFLNGAAAGTTRLGARELLNALLSIERERGRERPFQGAPRTLDLDLLLLRGTGSSRAGSDRAASAVPGASLRARTVGGDWRRDAGPGDRADGGAVVGTVTGRDTAPLTATHAAR